ncbi:DNA mismatch repair protein [Pectobacterium versatile]|uniref:ATP-binding protein n=1 Tax=Pectobacterium versatile TaxID=2488639 RepID=UPI000CDED0B8|nr:ATP-binding protein [Pectobacterium versatile]POY59328.1 DNA mismatch repair protein [Pectobacterium versatile]POY63564.1 DNA mismatch repair protein [Pectobacterium versatile]
MGIIKVEAKTDHLETVSKDNPFNALAELIWNGFDASSSTVSIFTKENGLGVLDSIEVQDSGSGIDASLLRDYFGGLGGSWKKQAKKLGSSILHGEKGRGRFKAYALGEHVEWFTVYTNKAGINYKYSIKGKINTINQVEPSLPIQTNERTGTKVVISNLYDGVSELSGDISEEKLAKIFCFFLTKYPNKKLLLNNSCISPDLAKKEITDYNLGDIRLENGKTIELKISIVEWLGKSERVINFCDKSGFCIGEYKIGQRIKAPNCDFSIFASSEYFTELNDAGLLESVDLTVDTRYVVETIIDKTRQHFLEKSIVDKSKVIEDWKKENIYPYQDNEIFNPIEDAERKVFDILAVNVQSYLKKFEKADIKTKKFTFRLLKQAIKDNPDSVQKILGEVLELKKTEQDDLALLLERTTLSTIISASKAVTNRLDFIKGLEQLLFDEETKNSFLERDQLHKILEKEAWIFREDFNLTGSEENLNEVLLKHLNLLGERNGNESKVIRPDGSTGRVDLMLSKARKPSEGKFDHLVVELKRASKKIDAAVIAQIKSYAFTVASDPRFDKANTYWTFIAVSNEFDAYAQEEASQSGRAPGLIHIKDNISVWIYTWAELLSMAKTRLSYFQKQLSYEANRESATKYLIETHEKFIPNIEQVTTRATCPDD